MIVSDQVAQTAIDLKTRRRPLAAEEAGSLPVPPEKQDKKAADQAKAKGKGKSEGEASRRLRRPIFAGRWAR